MQQLGTLLYEVVEGVAVIRLNRPERMNTLGGTMKADLARAFFELARDDAAVRCVVLTGTGDKAFCAGADIKERAAGAAHPADYYVTQQRTHELFRGIEEFEKPVIAAINGVALGGGLELAMACHIRICSDRAKLGLPEISLGIIPGFGGTVRLPRIVGPTKAAQMMLTDDKITAQEAYRVGLVNKVVPESDVMKEALGMAKKITSFGAKAIEAIMESLDYGRDHTLEESLENEANLFGRVSQTADMREGTTAFKEKRRPNFTDK